ncbi:MAG: threonine aldolase, partial [Chloroflexi bacterium]|nr:threonine aldolase [Chloroflexota bacterium]
DGILRRSDIERAIRPYDVHMPTTGLVCLENALGRGTVVPIPLMEEAYSVSHEHGLPVHTDGARAFNAAHALGVDIKEIASCTDSFIIHLSKGLCAPAGSVLLGPSQFIERARRYRHLLGGGMSQSGILAAAGIVALTKMVDRLAEDHINARYLSQLLAELPGVDVDLTRADINLVFFKINKPENCLRNLPEFLYEKGIKISPCADGYFRFVTHNDISKADIEYTIDILYKWINL